VRKAPQAFVCWASAYGLRSGRTTQPLNEPGARGHHRHPSGAAARLPPAHRWKRGARGLKWTPASGAAAVPGGRAPPAMNVNRGTAKGRVAPCRWARRCGRPISCASAGPPIQTTAAGWRWRRLLGPPPAVARFKPPDRYRLQHYDSERGGVQWPIQPHRAQSPSSPSTATAAGNGSQPLGRW